MLFAVSHSIYHLEPLEPPPPRVTKAFVNNATTAFSTNIDRAQDLYRKIVLHGYTMSPAGAPPVRMTNPDTRDAAQFIFFEVAAQFEDYAKKMFEAEIRAKLKVTALQSGFIMGDADRGMDTKLGWGSRRRFSERGETRSERRRFSGHWTLPLAQRPSTVWLLPTSFEIA